MTIATGAKPKEDLVISITRMFDAPRELVFQVFNAPKHIVRFWGPNGFYKHHPRSGSSAWRRLSH